MDSTSSHMKIWRIMVDANQISSNLIDFIVEFLLFQIV